MKKERVVLAWSGGKDSVVSLFELKSPEYRVLGLLTTFSEDKSNGRPGSRVQMHRVPRALIERQAASLELPLFEMNVEGAPSNSAYEQALEEALKPLKKKNLEGVAFGDLHLEDIKSYREQLMQKLNLKGVFPIWKWSKDEVLRVFLGLGYKAIVVAVDTKKLPLSFVGRAYDREFVASLPSNIDPCGENGEFHTFVYDGPFFQQTVQFTKGEVYEKDGFGFLEIS